jgi:signal transduction histidine kinase
LLNDLLDLSELDQDGIRYDFRRHSVSEIVEAALIEFEPIIREKQFRVHFAKPDFTDSCVLDEGKILQVIRNILTNAFEYSAVGGEIKIEIQRNETNYQVSIYDDGVGIPEGELETIFEKFVQSTRTKDGSGGTGLGLSISQKIITDHHGRIWAEKNGDGGTIIRFQLPNHQAP